MQNNQNKAFQIISGHFGVKRWEKVQNNQNWPFIIVTDHFGEKRWGKCEMTKIGHSK